MNSQGTTYIPPLWAFILLALSPILSIIIAEAVIKIRNWFEDK